MNGNNSNDAQGAVAGLSPPAVPSVGDAPSSGDLPVMVDLDVAMQAVPTVTSSADALDAETAAWLGPWLTYLKAVSKEEAWQVLVSKLVAFEMGKPPNGVRLLRFLIVHWVSQVLGSLIVILPERTTGRGQLVDQAQETRNRGPAGHQC
jgi:hypothetical protein